MLFVLAFGVQWRHFFFIFQLIVEDGDHQSPLILVFADAWLVGLCCDMIEEIRCKPHGLLIS